MKVSEALSGMVTARLFRAEASFLGHRSYNFVHYTQTVVVSKKDESIRSTGVFIVPTWIYTSCPSWIVPLVYSTLR